MDEYFLTPDNASPTTLRELFDEAMFETRIDADGDLIVDERFKSFVMVHSKRFVRFMTVFGIKEGAEENAVFALVNRINFELICVRACANMNQNALILDWYLPIKGGGLSKKSVVMAFREFIDLIGSIGRFDAEDVVA